jgi:5-oxoprolinase (ATP-hydrolysing) subunit C
MIEVLRPGLLTTVQDLGRPHLRHLGIAQSGAMDRLALTLGNRLVGNEPNAAGLEIHAGTPVRLYFLSPTTIALTGAELIADLDHVPLWPGWRIPVRHGQTLTLGLPRHGARTYLAIAGGIDVPMILGSRSTDLNARFGGCEGRALQEGDRLTIGPAGVTPHVASILLPTWSTRLCVLPGPEYPEFSPAAQQDFWRTTWTLRPQSNRMGYRLQGPTLTRMSDRELASHAVWPGTVQVPPSGEPIVLGADAQTTGGYPRIATVIDADLWKLAQLPLGGRLNFVTCDDPEARSAWQRLQRYLHRVDLVTRAH